MKEDKLPSRSNAEAILLKAQERNPGPWADHSRVVARIAETIARECGLDTHSALYPVYCMILGDMQASEVCTIFMRDMN